MARYNSHAQSNGVHPALVLTEACFCFEMPDRFSFFYAWQLGGISESRSAFFPLDYDGTLNSSAAVPCRILQTRQIRALSCKGNRHGCRFHAGDRWPLAICRAPAPWREKKRRGREQGQETTRRSEGTGMGMAFLAATAIAPSQSVPCAPMPSAKSQGDDLNNGHCHRRSRVDVVGGIF